MEQPASSMLKWYPRFRDLGLNSFASRLQVDPASCASEVSGDSWVKKQFGSDSVGCVTSLMGLERLLVC